MNYFYKNKSDIVEIYDNPIQLLKDYCKKDDYNFYKTCNIHEKEVVFDKITKEKLSIEGLLAECNKYIEKQVTIKKKLNDKYKESTLYFHVSNKKVYFEGEMKGILLRGDNSVASIKASNVNASVIGNDNIISFTSDFGELMVNGDRNVIIVNNELFYNGLIVNGEDNYIFVAEDVVTVRGMGNFILNTQSASIDATNSNYIVSLGKYAAIKVNANNILKIKAVGNDITCGGNNIIHAEGNLTGIETSSLQGEIRMSDDSVLDVTLSHKLYSLMNRDFKKILGTTVVSAEGLETVLNGQV